MHFDSTVGKKGIYKWFLLVFFSWLSLSMFILLSFAIISHVTIEVHTHTRGENIAPQLICQIFQFNLLSPYMLHGVRLCIPFAF